MIVATATTDGQGRFVLPGVWAHTGRESEAVTNACGCSPAPATAGSAG